MFREFLELLRSDDPLGEMYAKLVEMIAKSQSMFETAWGEAMAGRARPEVRRDIQRTDLEVNKAKRLIRRRLAEHIVAQPGANVPACLVLMSIVKDAERLGDYSKDILDAGGMTTGPLSSLRCYADFQTVYEEIRELFVQLRQALEHSDRDLAVQVMSSEREIGRCCDELLARLAAIDRPDPGSIPWALITRHLKRTADHLSNVASGLVMPLHKLDYDDEAWLGREPKPD